MIKLHEKYKGKRRIIGEIEAVEDLEIVIKCNESKENIPLDLINKANLVAKF